MERFRPQSPKDLLPPSPPWAPAAFDAAIFDFDGTIALSGAVWHEVDVAFFARRGLPLEPDVPGKLAALGFEEGADYLIDRYGLEETPQAIMAEWDGLAGELYQTMVELRPGVETYVARLRRAGIGVALATTNHRDVIERLAPRIDVAEVFDEVVYAIEVGAPKSEPDVFLEAARRLGAEPGRTVVFEDIPIALATARRAGFATVGVASGDPTQDVAEVRAESDLLIEDWTDLSR